MEVTDPEATEVTNMKVFMSGHPIVMGIDEVVVIVELWKG